MWKKLMACLITMAFICTSLLLTTGCAKKRIQGSGGTIAARGATLPGDKAGAGEITAEERREISAFESESIYFHFDKSVLTDEAKDNLRKKAAWLRNKSSYSILVEGHCDNRGTGEYNMALGQRRAYSAKKFLMALGIAESRISTVSYGEEKPADPRNFEGGWTLNRRDEFKVEQ